MVKVQVTKMKRLIPFLLILFVASCENSDPIVSVNDGAITSGQNIIHEVFAESDNYTLKKVTYADGQLLFDVSFSGGCKEHSFDLVVEDGILKTMPPGLRVFLKHESNDDMCEAWISEIVSVNVDDLINKVNWLQGRDQFSVFVVSPENEDLIATRLIINKN